MTYYVGQIIAAPCEIRARKLDMGRGVLEEHRALTWYLGRAVARQETRAEASLSNVGVAHYFPRETDWETRGVGRKRQKVKVKRSLFGGYGFIGLAAEQSAYALPRLEGFIGPVWMSKDCRPRGVPLAMIEKLVRQELNGDFDWTSNASALVETMSFEKDEIVRVVDGSFAGFNASIIRAPVKKRVEVFVSIFGRVTRVELPLSAIEKMA